MNNSSDFSDLLPPASDEEKISVLLDLLADPTGFTGDPDFDLVRDLSLQCLLQFSQLPDRTNEVMLGILAIDDESDLTLKRKKVAKDVLSRLRISE
jgi:hypothetical protein